MARWLDDSLGSADLLRLLIESPPGYPVGFAGLYEVDLQNRRAEFGILIGEDVARGKGLGTAVTHAFLELAFHRLHLRRVYLVVLATNAAASHMFEKCGFRQEGVARAHVFRNGQSVDLRHMGILADEFTHHTGVAA